MADYGPVQSPKIIYRQLTTSSLFASPRLFTGFASKGCISDTESIPSPTSILKNPFWPEPNTPKTPKPESKSLFEKLDSRGLVDALIDEKADLNDVSRTNTRMVLFGSNLKIQVPHVVSPNESPKSPTDFGIKTRGSTHLGPFSPRLNSSALSGLSPGEMERSEDYTCVISYGPNPRTTHIFDDCIVESCCGVVKLFESRFSERAVSCYPSESFLSSCYGCKKSLGQGKHIYMYRGEKAFCSNECQCMEMMLEESLEPDDYVYGAP